MSSLKIASIWNFNFTDSIFFHIFKLLSKKKVEIVDPCNCDLLFIGPFDSTTVKRRILKYFLNKTKRINLENYFRNIDLYSLRNYKPIRVFFSLENIRASNPFVPKTDFSICSSLGLIDENHYRFPMWKELIDWSHEGIIRSYDNLGNSSRYGRYFNLEELTKPQGETFLKKPQSFCFITSHLSEPKKSLYLKTKEHFVVDGFGAAFDKTILDHNSSNFKMKDIMKNYAFSLCPENASYPGFYGDRLLNAFASKCLPVTWADQNIKIDFNPNAFVNLFDYVEDDFNSIMNSLKEINFLQKFTREPLLLSKPNLDKEKNFVEKILKNLQ
jgi:hypothetical protein